VSQQQASMVQSVRNDHYAPREALWLEGSTMPLSMQWRMPIELSYRSDSPMPVSQFHSHAFYEVYYFHAGECNYLIGNQFMTLRPGDLILMHGMTLHCAHASTAVPYIRSIIHFDPAFIHRYLQSDAAGRLLRPFDELRNIRLSLDDAEREELERLLGELHLLNAQADGAASSVHAERFTFRFFELLELIQFWCAAPVAEMEHSSLKERHVQSLVSYVEANYSQELTLDDIAGALHLTKPYLSSLFKEVTGTTIFKYLYSRRINQAKILFRIEPGRTISDVSRAVGFQHLAHFSRLFKTAVGCSPEVYRKRLASQNDHSKRLSE